MHTCIQPANDLAVPGGVLTVRFTSTDSGHGEIEITMPDQETLWANTPSFGA